jgi:hypothetical protein
VTHRLDVLEKVSDKVDIKVIDLQLGWGLCTTLAGVPEQESERVAIAGDRVRARLHLANKALSKEVLE